MTPSAVKVARAALALFFFVAGANHFRAPEFYLPIMPPYLPWPMALIDASGAAEMAGAIGILVPPWRRAAAWGLIALLVAVLPANLEGAWNGMSFGGHAVPAWMLWARLPFQFVFIAWIHWTCLRPARRRTE